MSTVTTSKNTAPNAPLITILKATTGVLTHSEFYFPPGPSGLVGIQVRVANIQIFPIDRHEWLIGDNLNIAIDDFYELNTPPYELEIRTYNIDTDYEHLVQFRAVIMPIKAFIALHSPGISTEDMTGILEGITRETQRVTEESITGAFEVLKNGDNND